MKGNVYLVAHPEEACLGKWNMGAKRLKLSGDSADKIHQGLNNS
jgi:hypothetical protein